MTQGVDRASLGLSGGRARDDDPGRSYDDGVSDPFYRRYRALRLPRVLWLAARDVARLVRDDHQWPTTADEPSPARRQAAMECLLHPDPAAPPSVLLIVAHADDETLWAMSVMRALRASIRVVYVTDSAPRSGSLMHPTGHVTRAGYADARRQERRRALAMLGIGEDRVIDLGIVDQESRDHLAPLTVAIDAILARFDPDVVLTHAFEGGHPDHDATAYAVHTAARLRRAAGLPAPQLVEFAAYHRRFGRLRTYAFLPARGCEVRTVTLDEGARALKREMCACFPSQAEALRYFPMECERFRVAPRYDFTRPPNWERVLFWKRPVAGHPNRTLTVEMVQAADAAAARHIAARSSNDVDVVRSHP